MPEESTTNSENGSPDRWRLIRDIGVLQFKLVVDGLRDLILVPISLVVGLVSVVKSDLGTDNGFYQLLRLGKKSERWINLFGAADQVPEPDVDRVRFPKEDIDTMVSRVESFVIDEYRKGGVTKQAKERLDSAISALQKLAERKR